MSHVNSSTISGLATRDPEYMEMKSGNNLAKFGLAVERSWKDKDSGERVSKTSFFDINVWGPFADVIHAKVRKGDHLTVQGELVQDRWETDTGEKRSTIKIDARQIDGEALYRKADGSDTPERDEAAEGSNRQGTLTEPDSPPAAAAKPEEDDIPF
jgi:single-strand DNA-binding protein